MTKKETGSKYYRSEVGRLRLELRDRDDVIAQLLRKLEHLEVDVRANATAVQSLLARRSGNGAQA